MIAAETVRSMNSHSSMVASVKILTPEFSSLLQAIISSLLAKVGISADHRSVEV